MSDIELKGIGRMIAKGVELRRIAREAILISVEDSENDALGISEMHPELTDGDIREVLRLITSAKIEVTW